MFVAAVPTMMLLELFPMVSVPVPLSVTLATPMSSPVVFPPEFKLMAPLFTMFPSTVRFSLLLNPRLSPLLLSVRPPTVAFWFRLTEAVVVPIVTLTVLPFGTPALQLPPLFQLEPSPLPVQLSVVFGVGDPLLAAVAGC